MKLIRAIKKLKDIKDKFYNEKGSALVTVLILLFIFAIIGSAVLVTTINNMSVSQRISEYEDTYYIAEANAQYALTYIKEEVTGLYVKLKETGTKDKDLDAYEKEMADFYPTLLAKIESAVDDNRFTPMDFSAQGITTTVTFTIDNTTPIPTANFGTSGNAVRFLIESVAESATSRRVVNAVLVVDDPDIEWHETSAPPMTDRRILAAGNILSAQYTTTHVNALFCRGNVTAGSTLTDQFMSIHSGYTDYFTYDANNSINEYLRWDLQYSKFPTNDAFNSPYIADNFYSIFAASTAGSSTYYLIDDWFYETTGYYIKACAPIYGSLEYDNNDIIDSKSSDKDVDYYYTQETQLDTRTSTRYVGTADAPVRVYAIGNLVLSGTKNLEHCYIFAEGDITINIVGHIENSIIISNQGTININCDYIVNDYNMHTLIKAAGDINVILDVGSDMQYVVFRSMGGKITVDTGDTPAQEKITIKSCYFHTNKNDPDAMIYIKNSYLLMSYVSAGKDLVLRNCSGQKSSFYAFGYTDEDITLYGKTKLYLGATSTSSFLDYNNYMQFSIDRSGAPYYYDRLFRGIIVISELPPKANRIWTQENTYLNCDFTTGESIFVSDPRYQIAYGDQITDLASCRLLADREVLIEDVTMDECYVFAGIRGYEDEQSYYEIDGKLRLAVVRGIYMQLNHSHNSISNSVLYTRGRMMYSQHTPETEGYLISEYGKVRVSSSLFYSKGNFEYNGLTTSQGIDSTIIKNNDSLCNDMIIMTEADVRPHEFYPSNEDVVFIGGDMDISTTDLYTSGELYALYNGSYTTPQIKDGVEIQAPNLYDNYFEQKLTLEEIQLFSPGFEEVFVFEDIYEKIEAENGG